MRDTLRLAVGAALLGASTLKAATAFDGSVPLLCAVTGTVSCDAPREWVEDPAEAVPE